MKIGRNQPCPCGSGRKYKRCHWRKQIQMAKSASNITSGPTIEFEPPGFPGQNEVIVSQPMFPEGDSRNEGAPRVCPVSTK